MCYYLNVQFQGQKVKFTAEIQLAMYNVLLKGNTWLRTKGKVSVAMSNWSVENGVDPDLYWI